MRSLAMLNPATPLKQQSGVVLVISLVMLLLLTLIGLTGMQTTTLEEKMAGNKRNHNIAFQAAESALVVVEKSLEIPDPNNPVLAFTNLGTGGFYKNTTTVNLSDTNISTSGFWTTNPVATATISGLTGIAAAPLYIIQQLNSNTYRITVRATGLTTNAVVILQSIYVIP